MTMNILLLICIAIFGISAATEHKELEEEKCECVLFFNCDPNDRSLNTGGNNVLTIKTSFSEKPLTSQGCDGNLLKTCCFKKGHMKKIKKSPPREEFKPSGAESRPIPDITIPHKCGHPFYENQAMKLDIDIRIRPNETIHGFDNPAQFGEFPWMAAVLWDKYDNPEKYEYKCGGSLINRQYILTAAHCVYGLPTDEIVIRLGEWNTQTAPDHPEYYHVDHGVSRVNIHDRYRDEDKNLFDDIAVLKLQSPVSLNYHIDTICLPSPNSAYQYVGMSGIATGWGKATFGKDDWQSVLKKVSLPIWGRKSCQNSLKGYYPLSCFFCLHDTFLCAGGIKNKDTCEGDGGSPLVIKDPYLDAYVQIGIVAWGLKCNDPIPAAYIDVSRYTVWIDRQITLMDEFYEPEITDYEYEGNELYWECVTAGLSQEYNQFPSHHNCSR